MERNPLEFIPSVHKRILLIPVLSILGNFYNNLLNSSQVLAISLNCDLNFFLRTSEAQIQVSKLMKQLK